MVNPTDPPAQTETNPEPATHAPARRATNGAGGEPGHAPQDWRGSGPGNPAPDTAEPGILAQPVARNAHLGAEAWAWIVLLVGTVVARFVNLGARAMSHDESLHALYSYYLYNNGNYSHDPMMHGPFLFHTNALMYFLFGHNDTTARLVPALIGVGVVALAFSLRRYIGRAGALAAGLMLSISPSMLFHSRYIRNDIFIALFTLLWIYGAFRYMDARGMQRGKWLWVMVMGMAWGFIAKENHFMHGALLGVFFVGLALWQVIGQRTVAALGPLIVGIGIAYPVHVADQDLLAAGIVAVGVLASAFIVLRSFGKDGWEQLRRSDAADLAVIMLTMIMPFTAPFLHEVLGWDPLAAESTVDILRSAALIGVVTAVGTGMAYFWFGMRKVRESLTGAPLVGFAEWGRLMGGFWIIQILFFTTFLTNTRDGLASGIVGSLGYWLSQQEVARGGQPWYYYTMQSLLYESLPLILSLAGGIALVILFVKSLRGTARNLGRNPTQGGRQVDSPRGAATVESGGWDPVRRVDLPTELQAAAADPGVGEFLRTHRVYFVALCAWWVVGSWLAYTIAGEKMPWLLVHIATPMCIFGGWWLGRLITGIDWSRVREAGGLWIVGAVPVVLLLLAALARAWPEPGRTVDALATTMRAVVAVVVLLGVLWAVWRARRGSGLQTTVRLLAIGGVTVLLAFTVRFTYMLNYINFDYATEYLVYAHGTPDIKRALNEIDLISARTVGERNVVVAYDDNSAWPLSWYMRLYPNSRFYGANPSSEAMQAPVIIVGPNNYEKVHPYVSRDYVKRTYRLVWWPDQGYFNLTPQRFWATLTDGSKMRNLFNIFLYRRHGVDGDPNRLRSLTEWPNRHEFELHIRRDIAAQIWDLDLLPGVTLEDPLEDTVRANDVTLDATQVYDAVYDGAALVQPRSVAVGPAGERVIADTGNHRIVVLDAAGELIRTIGSHCALSEGAASGCSTDFGPTLGDGQFFEPWGVAVDADGNIFVADTWNGRIQVFDAQGQFVRKWGYFASAGAELADTLALFGPRGVAIDPQGNVLVADTGNKRIVQYQPTGEFVNQIGGGGVVAGRFEEPTDLEIDLQTGFVFVADSWNRRVQVLSADLEPLADWPVPGWDSRQIYHKPYITRAGNGDIYVTDPALFRVVVMSPVGEIKASFGRYGTEANQFGLPTGIAYDPVSNMILISDADNNRVVAYPALP
ncbi:MAG: flippase activity-associated protein Agl23 [Litorilinea sp.]